jgi:hypothetical protein
MSGENRRTGAIAEKSSIETDPIINAINDGIRGDIAFNLKHARYRATLILTYPAIDAMAEPVRAENGIERPVVLSQIGQAPNGKLARWSIDGKLQVDLKVLDGPV